MLRTVRSEAMNESPISKEDRQGCVFVCVQLQGCIWRQAGAKLAHNLVSVKRSVKIWLPAPKAPQPGQLKWNHTCSLSDRSLPSFPSTFSKVSLHRKGQLWREEQGANKHSGQVKGKDGMRGPHTSSVGVWHHSLSSKLDTRMTRQLRCCGNIEIHCPIGQCAYPSLPAAAAQPQPVSLQSIEDHRLQKHETWNWEQAQRIPLSHLSNRHLGGLFAMVTPLLRASRLVRLVCDGEITGWILATTTVLIPSEETQPARSGSRERKEWVLKPGYSLASLHIWLPCLEVCRFLVRCLK